MEHTNNHPENNNTQQHNDTALDRQVTIRSEKIDDLQAEAESIASALEGDVDTSNPAQTADNDLEKATTRGTQSTHEPVTRIQTAKDWLENDPENPQTWPMWRKVYSTFAIGMLAFAVTIGSSMITPSTPEIAKHFKVSRTASILSLTLYVLGLGMGPMIAAPISET